MLHKILFLRMSTVILLLVLINCQENPNDSYVISEHDRTKKLNRHHKFFYSNFNFILDTSETLYFHKKDSLLNCCDTGENYNYPDYIGLEPSDLKIVDVKEFRQIVDLVNNFPKHDKFSIQLATYSHTIKSKKFLELLKILDQKNFSNYDVRLITEEESKVLEAKRENKPYDFYKIKWKTRFSNELFAPPPPDSVIE